MTNRLIFITVMFNILMVERQDNVEVIISISLRNLIEDNNGKSKEAIWSYWRNKLMRR